MFLGCSWFTWVVLLFWPVLSISFGVYKHFFTSEEEKLRLEEKRKWYSSQDYKDFWAWEGSVKQEPFASGRKYTYILDGQEKIFFLQNGGKLEEYWKENIKIEN